MFKTGLCMARQDTTSINLRWQIYREHANSKIRFRIEIFFFSPHFIKKQISVVMTSLLTLPAHLLYQILDDLQPGELFLTAYNVCSRLNSIIDSYHPYQVKRRSVQSLFLQCILRINRTQSLLPSFHFYSQDSIS